MKKVMFIIALIMLPGLVFASDDYFYNVNKVSTEASSWNDINFTKSFKTENGYLYFKNKTLKYVDNKGNLIWDFQISKDNSTSVDILLDGENVIYTKSGRNGKTCKIKLENKEEIACVSFAGFSLADMGDRYVALSKNNIVTIDKSTFTISKTIDTLVTAISMLVDDSYVYAFGSDSYIDIYDKNLDLKQEVKTDFAKVYSGSDANELSDKSVKGLFLAKDKFIVSNFSVYEINKNGNTVEKIKGTDISSDDLPSGVNKEYHSGVYINNLFVVGGAKRTCTTVAVTNDDTVSDSSDTATSCGGYTPFVEVYDQSFKLLDTIKLANEFEDWAMVKNITPIKNDQGFLVKWIENGTLHVDEYSVRYNITTKTDGNGKIEVVDTALYGDQIVFRVNAKKNFTLKSIKLTGLTTNKTIEFTSDDFDLLNADEGYYGVSKNEFIMPDEDVLIEAIFESKITNPDTGISFLIPMSVLSIAVIGTVSFILIKKKKFI